MGYKKIEKTVGLADLSISKSMESNFSLRTNILDAMCQQTCPVKCGSYLTGVAFNLFRRSKLLFST